MNDDPELVDSLLVGAATALSGPGWPKRAREFPPGFHGANPGPSHEEDAPKPVRAPGRAPARATSPKGAGKPARRTSSTQFPKKKS